MCGQLNLERIKLIYFELFYISKHLGLKDVKFYADREEVFFNLTNSLQQNNFSFLCVFLTITFFANFFTKENLHFQNRYTISNRFNPIMTYLKQNNI